MVSCGWCTCGYIAIGVLAVMIIALKIVVRRAPRFDPNEKHIVITGGSSGIGLAAAKLLAARGSSITIIARGQAKIDAAVAEIRGVCRNPAQRIGGISASVAESKEISQAIHDAATANGGRIHALLACAGMSMPKRFLETPDEDFVRLMNVNYLGNVYAAKAVVPFMQAAGGGRIQLVSSMAGLAGVIGFSAYSPTKFALRGLGESLAMELSPLNIQVSVVNPPDVDTPGYAEENKTKPQECHDISAGSGLFKAEVIAGDMVAALIQWRFYVNTGFDGILSGIGAAGMTPPSSISLALIETFFGGIIRFVSLFYIHSFYNIVHRAHRKRVAEAAKAKAQ